MRIMIAEDDAALAGFVRQGLQGEHYTVDVAEDGEQARAMGSENDYDLAILDLNLPRLDGVSVLRHLRLRRPSLPVLILTQRSKVEERVQCLDMGADDYLPKPFSFSELSARIRALLRRSHLPSESVLVVDDLKLDRVEHRAERAGQRIELTGKEFALLEYLMRNAGRQVSRTMIIEHVWNMTFDTTTNVVDVYINYASSQVDKRKVGRIALAIQVAFQEMGVFAASTTQVPLNQNDPMPFSTVQAIENVERTAALGRIASPPTDSLAGATDEDDLSTLQSELRQALHGEIASHQVSLHREIEGLVVSLREFGFFDIGSAELKPGALPALDRIASLLAIRTYALRIEGHTDNVPIHNLQMASNWELSTGPGDRVSALVDSAPSLFPSPIIRRRICRISSRYQQRYGAGEGAKPPRRHCDPLRTELRPCSPAYSGGPPISPWPVTEVPNGKISRRSHAKVPHFPADEMEVGTHAILSSQLRSRPMNPGAGEQTARTLPSEKHGREVLLQLVGFHVGQEEFGIDILRVQEIIRTQQLTRVPNSPDSMEGVMNLRGKIIPVIALRRRFGLEEIAPDKQNRIVVVEIQGTVLGFIVDAVSEVLRIPSETVEPPPRLGTIEREYVAGVGKLGDRLLILLDTDRLMTEAEPAALSAVAAQA